MAPANLHQFYDKKTTHKYQLFIQLRFLYKVKKEREKCEDDSLLGCSAEYCR
jgi:hypothetical protein